MKDFRRRTRCARHPKPPDILLALFRKISEFAALDIERETESLAGRERKLSSLGCDNAQPPTGFEVLNTSGAVVLVKSRLVI